MLFFQLASFFFVVGTSLFVAADEKPNFAPPEIRTSSGNPNTSLKPYIGNPVRRENGADAKVIRGLLTWVAKRQSCPGGSGLCNDGTTCCPVGGQCCGGGNCCPTGQWCYSTGCCDQGENGCESVSCCPSGSECCQGGGCCEPGYYCTVVNGQRGCCQNGEICTSGGGDDNECVNTGYEPCAGEDFCCPAGYTCYRDSSNNPECSLGSANTLTSTSTNRIPTSTPTSTRFISTATIRGDSSSSSSSTSVSGPSGFPNTSSQSSNGATDWKNIQNFFGFVPLLVFTAYVL